MNADKRRLVNASEGDPPNLNPRPAKIDQQAEGKIGGSQIVQALRQIHVLDSACVLQFDQDGVFDKDIGHVFADNHAIVSHAHAMLDRPQGPPAQLVNEAFSEPR
jgi:hypothetical protein